MVELEILGVSQAEEHQYPVVLLRHENRVLPILVGIPEASAIQIGLMREKTPRPMTHDLVCNLLAGLRGELQSVTIYQLQNDTFFAHLNIEQKNPEGHVEQVLRIDSRPSDGIAIAVRLGCPIYAAEEVMEMAGQDASLLASPDDSDDTQDEDDDDEPF
ncbi:MAG TPA: bifunctional nuclease family protein [Candidatus Hydrogenedentes bacterium]|nr:bifunctional nuclease family protein [Candidatus Hydrogenedentota bacterium]